VIRRREFITLLGGATTAWPLAARAQQPALPMIGFLAPTSPDASPYQVRGLRMGLKEAGYVEGENLAIVHRWAENRWDRRPAMAADLVARNVAVIVAAAPPAAFAAIARPGGNLTGLNFLSTELAAKRLELLRELVPGAVVLPCSSIQSMLRRPNPH
jgi:putative ABC transport system substrate-binding protein